jgi:RNA polymerase sigma factor (sigma-70 family)
MRPGLFLCIGEGAGVSLRSNAVTAAEPVAIPARTRDDDALVVRAGRGDRAAFRALIDRHGARPYRIAWRMLADQAEAEDVAQEALLRLWSQARNWQAGQGGVSAFLARVATNLCLDRLRKRKFASDEEVPERIDEAPLADAAMAANDEQIRARAAIEALPERQRAAIILTYFEEVANRAAAEMMEMDVKAFESLLHRARAALRASLSELQEDRA